MIIPNTDVNLATEVRDVLNTNGGSVSNDITTFFKQSANINKWAKFKPESFEIDFDLDENMRFENNYGFDLRSIGIGAPVSELFENAQNNNNWIYVLPTGGKESPFRLGDFRLYNSNAIPPFDYRHLSKSAQTQNGTANVSQRIDINNTVDSEIKIEDLAAFENLQGTVGTHYFIISRKENGNNYDYVISNSVPTTTSFDENGIICDIYYPSDGQWQCIFCIGHPDSNNDSSYISARTDCLIMPGGYFVFSVNKKAVWINVTMTDPNPESYDSYITYDPSAKTLNLGTTMFKFEMIASDPATPIQPTNLCFGFVIYPLDQQQMQLGPVVEIWDESGTGEGIYTGTEATSWIVPDFQQFYDMNKLFDEGTLQSTYYFEIRPITKTMSGNATGYFPTSYVWYINATQ